MVKGFHHIALNASDLDKSVEFYKAIGLTERVRWGEGEGRAVMMNMGDGGCIEIFGRGEARERVDERFLHLAFKTDDVDGTYQASLNAGAKPMREPCEVAPEGATPVIKMRIAFVFGPDGELLEFFDEH